MIKEALKILKQKAIEVFKWESLYAFYLGVAVTSFGGISLLTWQWWAIIVPTIMMVNFFKKED